MEGSTYVPVMARSTFSAPENGSEIDPGGGTSSGYYIHWNDGGFTGKGWQHIKPFISYTGFPEVATQLNVTPTYESFEQYVTGTLPGVSKPNNLNTILGNGYWDNAAKNEFVSANVSKLGIFGKIQEDSMYGQWISQDGCIEAL